MDVVKVNGVMDSLFFLSFFVHFVLFCGSFGQFLPSIVCSFFSSSKLYPFPLHLSSRSDGLHLAGHFSFLMVVSLRVVFAVSVVAIWCTMG